MDINGITSLMELMGADKEQVDRVKKMKFEFDTKQKEDLTVDFVNGDVNENHKNLLNALNKTIWSFENADEVECDINLINDEMLEMMWTNINVYSYDIESFFLDKFVFYLKKGKELFYKIYFSIEDGSIFLYSMLYDDYIKEYLPFVGGTIAIQDGKFIPLGAINEEFVDAMVKTHKSEGLSYDRQFMANRSMMNCLLYIIIVNQMVNQSREIITETTKVVDISKKKKGSKKKKVQKRVKQVRYIKVDNTKVQKIREEYERAERESYERHVSEWSRIGHWKTLRNGERRWIKPTICHAHDKVGERVVKLYKLK